MKDLISKLLVDENIQDIPVIYICRIAVELVKLSEETMISPSIEDPVNLIKYRNRLLDTVRLNCDCDTANLTIVIGGQVVTAQNLAFVVEKE